MHVLTNVLLLLMVFTSNNSFTDVFLIGMGGDPEYRLEKYYIHVETTKFKDYAKVSQIYERLMKIPYVASQSSFWQDYIQHES